MGASARIASARRAAFAPRAAALLLLVAFACVAPLAAGAGDAHAEDGALPLIDIDTEPPEEHLHHITDEDGDTYVDKFELATLFQMLQSKVMAGEAALSAANDPHAGHAHAQDEAEEIAVASEPTHMLSVEQILDHYAGEGITLLTEAQFHEACPALLMCAAEATCEFEHEVAHTDEDVDSTAHLGLKIGLLAGIFALSLVGGLAPLAIKNIVKVDGLLALVNCFSGGVFLCAGLTHILPHVVEHGASVKGYGEYPLPYVLVMLGYMLVFLVERVVFHIHKHAEEHDEDEGGHGHGHGHGHGSAGHSQNGSDSHKLLAGDANSLANADALRIAHRHALYASVSVLVAISLHAVLAGVSLGMQGSTSRVAAVAVAICSHKGPAAFSVGSKFLRSGLPTSQVVALVLAFTLVTPFGIVVGILSGGASPIAKLVLEGLGCGTFLYIGATEISSDEFEMTARACDEMHGPSAAGLQAGDAEKAGHAHTHHSHEPPSRSARLLAFSAYALGVFAILMSNFAPHAD